MLRQLWLTREESQRMQSELQVKIENLTKELDEAETEKEVSKIEKEVDALEREKKDILSREQAGAEGRKRDKEVNFLINMRNNGGDGKQMEAENTRIVNSAIALRNGESWEDRLEINTEEKKLDLGKYVRGMVTGKWKGAELEQRALLTTATGTLIPTTLSAKIIDLARKKCLLTAAGVPVIPMESNNVIITKIKSDPSFSFKEEGVEASPSTMELEGITLQSKTIYGYAYISLEAIESSLNLEAVIRNAFSQALAEGIDNAGLYGQYNGTDYDSFAPSGILNNTAINTITATEGEGYDSIIKAIGAVNSANGKATAMGVNAQTDQLFALLKDQNDQYLSPPKTVTDLRKIVSNQLTYDETNGSDALVFDPNALVIGIQNNTKISLHEGSDECIKKGLVCLRIYSMIDVAEVQPKHIAVIKGIK